MCEKVFHRQNEPIFQGGMQNGKPSRYIFLTTVDFI